MNRNRLATALEAEDWPEVAQDVREDIPLEIIAGRLIELGEIDSEALRLVEEAMPAKS